MARITDTGTMEKWISEIDKLGSKSIEIGIFGSDAGEEILLRATSNEFGANIKVTEGTRAFFSSMGMPLSAKTRTIRIPERSFIRGYFRNEEKRIQKVAHKLIGQVVMQEITADEYFDAMGQEMVSGVQKYLTDLKSPPNHPLTIAMKRSSNPLIDTGQMRNSITYRVV